ncbi:MAG TPA: hypothetical protein PKY77_23365 [Phycisphaerae bacterium]|nr:hypothetical protein [Phycisphaerae bacterium]HRY69242.1 hypothetical protein [Phycisphaerae bacterium]HSA26560.1 hypothetical protein [Phycisphaerae bacterium]
MRDRRVNAACLAIVARALQAGVDKETLALYELFHKVEVPLWWSRQGRWQHDSRFRWLGT